MDGGDDDKPRVARSQRASYISLNSSVGTGYERYPGQQITRQNSKSGRRSQGVKRRYRHIRNKLGVVSKEFVVGQGQVDIASGDSSDQIWRGKVSYAMSSGFAAR